MWYANSEPLIIVSNPNSTGFHEVQHQVLDALDEWNVEYEHFETRFKKASDNIRDIEDWLPDKGRVITVAGDGTVEQVANAALTKPDIKLGVLPYGNYNDTAYTHIDRYHNVIDLMYTENTIDRHPVSLEVNGQHETHAFSYATIGLLARIAAGFDDRASRERMKSAGKFSRTIRRYGQAALDGVRNIRFQLPPFSIDGGDVQTGRTDIAIANNPHVAGLLHLPDTYFDKAYFGVRADLAITHPRDIFGFGLPALFGSDVLNRASQMRITFESAAQSLPLQVGGEYKELDDVHEIFVYKDANKKVTYLHPIADNHTVKFKNA